MISNNPANLALIFDSVYNAVTLRPVKEIVFNFGVDKYDLAKEKTDNKLEILDIKKDSIFWSLGIFAIFLIGIILVTLLYYAIRFLKRRVKKFNDVEIYLRKKLFFRVWIRYLIQSSLKLCYACFTFLIYVGLKFDTWANRANSALNIAILVVLIVWPFFLTFFLLENRQKLDKKKFKDKF